MRKIKSEVLQAQIAKSGMSLHAWAIRNGFTQPTVYSWITGKKGISERNIKKLEQILGLDKEAFTTIVFRLRHDRIAEYEREQEELVGLFAQLSSEQRGRVLRLVRSLADANKAEEDLLHGLGGPR